MKYEIKRYKKTRFWGIFLGERLITVCVYKKGANAVVALLESKLVNINLQNLS